MRGRDAAAAPSRTPAPAGISPHIPQGRAGPRAPQSSCWKLPLVRDQRPLVRDHSLERETPGGREASARDRPWKIREFAGKNIC